MSFGCLEAGLSAYIPQFDLVTEDTESGRSPVRNTYWVVIREFVFTYRVAVSLGDVQRHFSVRSVLTSVHSVFNGIF